MFGADQGIRKVSVRDIAHVVATGVHGATTVASTMRIAALAGIRVFVTGGLGGVHQGAESSMDVSADLTELSRTEVVVISAGVKSILDIGRTLEVLETLEVPVVGYGTDDFPSFFSRSSGIPVPMRVDTPEEAARMVKAQFDLGLGSGISIANPVPAEHEMAREDIDDVIARALADCAERGITGKDITPFLLGPARRAVRRAQPADQPGPGAATTPASGRPSRSPSPTWAEHPPKALSDLHPRWLSWALVRVRVLGSTGVEGPQGAVPLPARKPRSILAALALTPGGTVSADRLVDLVWGDDPPAGAHGTLHAYLSGLRRVLEPDLAPRARPTVLVTTDDGYRLDLDPAHVDAVAFSREVRARHGALAPLWSQLTTGPDASWPSRDEVGAHVEALEEALRTWTGTAYADLGDHPDVLADRAALDELRATAQEDTALGLLALGEHAAVLAATEQAGGRNPLRERTRSLQALALVRTGRQVEALELLRGYRELLADELGLDPGPEVRALEEAVLRQSPSLGAWLRPEVTSALPAADPPSAAGAPRAARRPGAAGTRHPARHPAPRPHRRARPPRAGRWSAVRPSAPW